MISVSINARKLVFRTTNESLSLADLTGKIRVRENTLLTS